MEQKWQDNLERQQGRLLKYSRFSIDAKDARRHILEDIWEAYNRLLKEELADVYILTPSPPPSPILEALTRFPKDTRPGYRLVEDI